MPRWTRPLIIIFFVALACSAKADTTSKTLLDDRNWIVEFQNVDDGANFGCLLTTFNDNSTNLILLWSRNMEPVVNVISPKWDLGKGSEKIVFSIDGKVLQTRATTNRMVAGTIPNKNLYNSLIGLLKRGRSLEIRLGSHRETFRLRGSSRAIGVALDCADKIGFEPPKS